MTDQEIAKRIAEECLGWEPIENGVGHVRGWWSNPELGQFQQPEHWNPRTDARDTELVWNWLRENAREFKIEEEKRWGTSPVFRVQTYAILRFPDGVETPVVRHTEGGDWKETICLAALEVAAARKGRG